jgi:hypothetical protein
MTRWIVALGLGLALVAPFATQADADGVERRRAVYGHKRCIAPAMWWGGGQTTWVCTASQKCCYDRLLRKGNCLEASERCF